ncbi:site-specific integrase [Thiomicrorhabdus aquaedulcis]|uniref:site-specific integrase n=1 Tax=Thiomicrorhabdus aquaedulcis TaxID=2211106 RepID=UPI001E356AF7|nr:site-specific integrase [Thiomicrorhabdus aquaedulcis]
MKCDPPFIKLLKEPKKRVRWLTESETQRLIMALSPHLADMVIFSLETGLRESNVTLLRWEQVDLSQRIVYIEGDDILKSEKAFVVPLSEIAINVIKRQVGKHSKNVFTYKGNPIRRANTKSFKNACEQVGIENLRWHDLRHTWATWHIQRGTPLEVLQELGGWSDFKMVKRYAHFTHQHLQKYVNRNPTNASTNIPTLRKFGQ